MQDQLTGKKIIAFLDHYKITTPPEDNPEYIGMLVLLRSGKRPMIVIPIHQDEIDELIEGLQLLREKYQVVFEKVD